LPEADETDPLAVDPLAGTDPLMDVDFGTTEDRSPLDTAASSLPQKETAPKGISPLVWALVGGGTLLALMLIVGVVMLLMSGDDETVVADGAPTEAGAPDNAGPSPKDTAPEPTEPEAAPEPTETKPAAKPAPPAQSDPIVLNTEDLPDIQGKLKRIALAFHNFHDTYRCFALPRSGASSESPSSGGAKPTSLSWRVHLLPFLQQQPLYDRFHLDEPWDSPHNKTLLEHMPDVYHIGSNDEPTTRFQVITGPGMLFGNPKPSAFRDITDGSSNTILAVVVGADVAVPWTKPDELTLDENSAKSSLGSLADGYIACVLVDGRTLTVLKSIEAAGFLALATPRGNEIAHPDRHGRRFEGALRGSVAKSKPPSDTTTDMAASPGSTQSPSTPAASPLNGLDLHGKLQAIGFALLMHHDHFRMFTHPVSESEHGSGLSWRVHVLPFLGEQALYSEFHLDEPWDSPHNKSLLDEMPDVYRLEDPAQTRFVVLTGPEMIFGVNRQPTYQHIKDGPANTLLVVVVGPDSAVPWTQPVDLPFEPENAASLIQRMSSGPIECVTADGKLLTLPDDVPEASFKGLATPAGGEVIDVDALRKQFGPADQEPPTALKRLIQTVSKTKQERLNKLKQIFLGMMNYHDVYRQYPLARNPKLFNAEGQPYLSWRVHLLPFLDQGPLYKQFKLDEPWDSPHNMELLKEIPDIYRDLQDPIDSTNTRFLTLTGPGASFTGQYGPSMRDFRDGTSTTILAVCAGADKSVPWTKPEDLAFDPSAPVACLGNIGSALFCVKADGACQTIKPSIPPEIFKGLVSPAGGEAPRRDLINYGYR